MSQALPVIGAVVGSFFTGGLWGISYATWGMMAGSLAASAMQKGQHQQGPRLDDRTVVGTTYGQSIPFVCGSPRLSGQYVWASQIREIANTKKVGKGGSSKVTTYTYECDVMIMLTENVTVGVARDWLNAELVRNDATVKDGIWAGVTIYTGEDDQMPDPTYEAAVGAGNAPAMRGHTTIVIRSLQLNNGNSLPNLEHQAVKNGVIIDDNDYQDKSQNNLTVVDDHNPGQFKAFMGCVAAPGMFGFAGEFRGGLDLQGLTIGSVPNFPPLGRGNWTVQARMRAKGSTYASARGVFVSNTVNAVPINGMWFYFGSDGGLEGYIRSDTPGNSYAIQVDSAPAIFPLGETFHFAVERTGTIVTAYVNGEPVATGVLPENAEIPANQLWTLGSMPGGFGDSWNGYIDEFVVTNEALYNGPFTPPSVPHTPNRYTQIYIPFNRIGGLIPGTEPLGDVLAQLMRRGGYEDNEFSIDPSIDDHDLYGYQTGDISSTRAHLETMRPFGKYESFCSDKLYIFPRAVAPVGTIDWKDLGAAEGADPVDPFPLEFGNEKEIPAQLALRYRNVAADWNVGTEFSDRIVSSAMSTQTADMPFGLMPEQAKSVVESMLLDLKAGLGRVTLRCGGRKYAKFNPGDVVNVTHPRGRTYRLRILVKRDTIGMIEFACVLDDASVLNPPAITYEGYVPTENPVRIAPTIWETLAIPPLRDSDATTPGPYVALAPNLLNERDQWPGAVFVRARFPEAYEQVFISGDRCVIGETTSSLATFARGSWGIQRGAAVRVRVLGELSSSTPEDFFVDRTINAAVIGNEPVRFMRADFVGVDGMFSIYDLSNFLRGQLGQEHEIVTHPSGTRFVLLDNSLRRMVNETTDINVAQQVKAVTLNTLLSSVDGEDFTDSGIALKPYSVARLKAVHATGGVMVNWVRRSRLVARYTDTGIFAPLGEAFEVYRVRITNATPPRTITVNNPEWLYADADIASDGFSPGETINITVAQMSDTVGEGFQKSVEITAP